MNLAADFKRKARESLKGRWGVAIGTGIVAMILGGTSSYVVASFNTSSYDSIKETAYGKYILAAMIITTLVSILVKIFVGGPVFLGYTRFNLNLVDGKEATVSDLFSQFKRFGSAVCMVLLQTLYITGWTLMLIIPGIIKAYSYAMTSYILLEHPEMSANQAITESRRIMDGNKYRLFCLDCSFIGWTLLCSLPMISGFMVMIIGSVLGGDVLVSAMIGMLIVLVGLGIFYIGYMFLLPYMQAAYAAFYRDITATETIAEVDEF